MEAVKRILFITGEYPAFASPTSLAASFVIDHSRNDYEVYCLSIRNNGNHKSTQNTRVIHMSDNNGDILSAKFKSRLWLRVNQILTIPIYPILHPKMQHKLNKKAFEICSKYKIDAIVGVSFPFEAVIAGAYVKKKIPEIIFIPYLIDAYSCGTPPKYLPQSYSNRRRLWYEHNAISNADGIIAMKSGREFYEKQEYECYHKIYYLNPAFFVEPKRRTDKSDNHHLQGYINIVYTGYLYLPDRNPTYAIRLFSSLKSFKVRLTFIGRTEVKDIIEKEKKTFNGELSAPGFMKHEQLEDFLMNADFLLHMGVSNGSAISGKIFEYMSYGKPIIALYHDPNEATLPYLEKYPYAICINIKTTPVDIATILIEKFITENMGKVAEPSSLKALFYDSTPDAFWDVLNSIVEEKFETLN